MTNVIDLSRRRAAAREAVPSDNSVKGAAAPHSSDVADTLTHLANTADAIREMLGACSKEATAEALEKARMTLAFAVVTMPGPDWELARYGDE